MTAKPRLSTYADIYPVLDALISAGGGYVECETPGRATRWRQRGYMARAAFVKRQEEMNASIPGYSAATPYDGMHLKVEGTKVKLTMIEPVGGLTDLEGNPIAVPKAKVPDELRPERTEENEDFIRNLVTRNE